MKNGIHWDELDNDEKEEYEETFVDEEGNVPKVISASAINQYVFNKDTVRKVLATLFKYGIMDKKSVKQLSLRRIISMQNLF